MKNQTALNQVKQLFTYSHHICGNVPYTSCLGVELTLIGDGPIRLQLIYCLVVNMLGQCMLATSARLSRRKYNDGTGQLSLSSLRGL